MNSLNYTTNPYPLARNATIARNGMIATSQPLASDAGMEPNRFGRGQIIWRNPETGFPSVVPNLVPMEVLLHGNYAK